MNIEIERKFLVNKEKWNKTSKDEGILIEQGYISKDPAKTVRVRLTKNKGFLTIKGPSVGASRKEFEYSIPASDAERMLKDICGSLVRKKRYKITHKEKLWEVDEFLDDNAGLIIAEIELSDEHEKFDLPAWIGKEVTYIKRYSNLNLSLSPYRKWKR